jgi:hypothetical protein
VGYYALVGRECQMEPVLNPSLEESAEPPNRA